MKITIDVNELCEECRKSIATNSNVSSVLKVLAQDNSEFVREKGVLV